MCDPLQDQTWETFLRPFLHEPPATGTQGCSYCATGLSIDQKPNWPRGYVYADLRAYSGWGCRCGKPPRGGTTPPFPMVNAGHRLVTVGSRSWLSGLGNSGQAPSSGDRLRPCIAEGYEGKLCAIIAELKTSACHAFGLIWLMTAPSRPHPMVSVKGPCKQGALCADSKEAPP